jgi:AcrR family transcriptional regulator
MLSTWYSDVIMGSTSDMQRDARPRANSDRSELKRHRILQSAEDLFLTHGFDGTSMDDVAVHANVSKQTVYNQFADKASLFVEIIQSLTARASDRVQTEMGVPKTVAQVATELSGHAERLLTIVLTPRLLRLRRLVIAETDRFPELGRALYDDGPGRAIADLAGHMRRWADRGLLSINDAMVAATQFNWLVMGEPVNKAMFRPDYILSQTARVRHIDKAVCVFIAAYRSKS